jgi:predicted DNA-binding antitoxin AbrB/MazE fold protein
MIHAHPPLGLGEGRIEQQMRRRDGTVGLGSIFPSGERGMSITVEAVYENGTLKLRHPLPFKEQERVRVTVETQADPTDTAVNRVRATAGLIAWTGDAEVFRQIAEDDAFGILESP